MILTLSAEGGGAVSIRSVVDVTITDSRFERNSAASGGAIISDADGITLTIKKSYFLKNIATDFGGAVSSSSHTIIDTTIFDSNEVNTSSGGAVHHFEDGGPVRLQVTGGNFTQNKAVASGGGLNSAGTTGLFITDVAFYANSVVKSKDPDYGNGGGLNIEFSLAPNVTNANATIIRGYFDLNTAYNYGGGITVTGGGDLTIQHSHFFNNSASTVSGGGIAQRIAGTKNDLKLNSFSATYENTSFVQNNAQVQGGGLYVITGANTVIKDCVIRENRVSEEDGGPAHGGGLAIAHTTSTCPRCGLSQCSVQLVGDKFEKNRAAKGIIFTHSSFARKRQTNFAHHTIRSRIFMLMCAEY